MSRARRKPPPPRTFIPGFGQARKATIKRNQKQMYEDWGNNTYRPLGGDIHKTPYDEARSDINRRRKRN